MGGDRQKKDGSRTASETQEKNKCKNGARKVREESGQEGLKKTFKNERNPKKGDVKRETASRSERGSQQCCWSKGGRSGGETKKKGGGKRHEGTT